MLYIKAASITKAVSGWLKKMGKGSKTRPTDKKNFDKGYGRIFKKKIKKKSNLKGKGGKP